MPLPLEVLKKYWNYDSFRVPQEEIINNVLDGRDTLALLPTGGGKSLCFQVPAMTKEGICIVISPLVALIRNQVDLLTQKGIKAAALTGSLKIRAVDRILDNCIYGGYKFLYLSPERLQQELVQQRIKQMKVNLIAIDEAHCISQWGNDFRPAYRNCSILRAYFPNVNMIALTASATKSVVNDIIENLKLREASIVRKSFERENIAYMVFEEADKWHKTAHILKKNKGTAIVYVRNRKATGDVAAYLNKQGISATFYHGGISPEEKTKRLHDWLHNDVKAMVATNAFGMGIDKPDVRVVIHIQLPENIENYYQEAGRAGRDGAKAFAVLLKNKGDSMRVKKQFLDVQPDVSFMKLLYKKLNNYFQIPYGSGKDATFVFNFNSFCTTYQLHTGLTYNGIRMLDSNSIISLSESFNSKTSLQFRVGNQRLFGYLDQNPGVKAITQTILRTYGGVFDHETGINLHLIGNKTSTTLPAVQRVLEQLHRDEIIHYKAQHTDVELTFLVPREDEKTIYGIANHIKQQYRLKKQQINAIIDYMNNDTVCKSIQLLSYFGETQAKPCGICSVCIGKKQSVSKETKYTLREAVLTAIDKTPLSSRELAKRLPCNEQDLLVTLRYLLENEEISITDNNTYKLLNE